MVSPVGIRVNTSMLADLFGIGHLRPPAHKKDRKDVVFAEFYQKNLFQRETDLRNQKQGGDTSVLMNNYYSHLVAFYEDDILPFIPVISYYPLVSFPYVFIESTLTSTGVHDFGTVLQDNIHTHITNKLQDDPNSQRKDYIHPTV
jgi:hypothetical protein